MTTSSRQSAPNPPSTVSVRATPVTGDEARTVFGQVMGLFGVTIAGRSTTPRWPTRSRRRSARKRPTPDGR